MDVYTRRQIKDAVKTGVLLGAIAWVVWVLWSALELRSQTFGLVDFGTIFKEVAARELHLLPILIITCGLLGYAWQWLSK